MQILTLAVEAIALVAVATPTTIRTIRVDAVGIFVAQMRVGRTLVHLGAVKFVDAPEAGQTIAHIRADRVLAHRIRMAMVAELIALLGALVNIYRSCVGDDRGKDKRREREREGELVTIENDFTRVCWGNVGVGFC